MLYVTLPLSVLPPKVFVGTLKSILPVSEAPVKLAVISSAAAGAPAAAFGFGTIKPTNISLFGKSEIFVAAPVDKSTVYKAAFCCASTQVQ